MTGFLLDTHVWLWYLAGSAELPKGLRSTIDGSAGDCWLSPVSVWEAGLLASRGRIRMRPGLREWVARATQRFPLREAPVNLEVAVRTHEIKLPHRDPADHFIAATALVYELTLLTVDERLAKARWLRTRSR